MPCDPFKVNRHFGGIYRLYLQGRIISQARNQCEAGSKQNSCCLVNVGFLLALFFEPEDGGDTFL
jgi:hypothetical protein